MEERRALTLVNKAFSDHISYSDMTRYHPRLKPPTCSEWPPCTSLSLVFVSTQGGYATKSSLVPSLAEISVESGSLWHQGEMCSTNTLYNSSFWSPLKVRYGQEVLHRRKQFSNLIRPERLSLFNCWAVKYFPKMIRNTEYLPLSVLNKKPVLPVCSVWINDFK